MLDGVVELGVLFVMWIGVLVDGGEGVVGIVFVVELLLCDLFILDEFVVEWKDIDLWLCEECFGCVCNFCDGYIDGLIV